MKKKQISILILALVLFMSVFSTSIIDVQAKDTLDVTASSDEVTVSIPNGSSNTTTSKGIRLPNAVTVKVTPSETGLTIKVRNIGVDTIDSVTVKIKSPKMYGQSGSNTKTVTFTKILPAISKTKTMSIPMVRTKMTYKGNVTITDGAKVAYKTTNSSLSFSNDQLGQDWLKGTFSTLRDSLDYHYKKHHNDKYVKVKNMGQYLRVSASARKEMKNITISNKGKKYTVSNTGDAKKVKNKTTKKYIKIKNSNKKLYTFGGN